MKRLEPYILLAPLLFMMSLLFGYPIYKVLWGSFHQIAILDGSMHFVGFENYRKLLESKVFLSALSLTFRYTAVTVLLKLSLGFAMALFMTGEMYFSKTLKFLSLLPWALQQAAVAVIWKWILDGNYGYLNYYLQKLGLLKENIAFLSDPTRAFFAAAFVDTWLGLPMVSMMFMAGLSAINPSLYESAKVDGAGVLRRFFSITCPCIKKVFLVCLILVGIWTFNSFNVIFVLTGGGPMRATETLILKIHEQAFAKFNLGSAYALSSVAVIILLACSLLYFKMDVEEA